MDQPTCKERISDQLMGRMEDINRALELQEKDIEENEEGEGVENLRENILSLDKHITVNMLLSTGGPEDGFEFDLDSIDKEVIGGHYIFKDWFDGARHDLSEAELEKVLKCYGLDYYTLMGE